MVPPMSFGWGVEQFQNNDAIIMMKSTKSVTCQNVKASLNTKPSNLNSNEKKAAINVGAKIRPKIIRTIIILIPPDGSSCVPYQNLQNTHPARLRFDGFHYMVCWIC